MEINAIIFSKLENNTERILRQLFPIFIISPPKINVVKGIGLIGLIR